MAIGRKAATAPQGGSRDTNIVGTAVSYGDVDGLMAEERSAMRRKVAALSAVIIALAFCSCGIGGAVHGYMFFTPLDVAVAFAARVHDIVGAATHLWPAYSAEQLDAMLPQYAYEVVWARSGVVLLTLVCGVLLSVSGMLFQNAFKNPLAGPGMLGVGSGVGLGIMILVVMYGAAATAMTTQRYLLCYALGAAVLAFVMAAGKWISGSRPLNLVDMLLVGSIVSQLLGVVTSFVVLWILDDEAWMAYYTISQMLVIDTSPLTWISLGIASAAAVVPVWAMRFRMNALSSDDAEAKLMGISPLGLRGTALLCGSVMILAAQIHTGMVGMVSLVVPFMARSYFGCEFRKQLTGNVLLGMLVLLVCRDVADSIEFVGAGLGVGSVVAIVVLPIVIYVFARGSRAWE